jgi:hypothetical protein
MRPLATFGFIFCVTLVPLAMTHTADAQYPRSQRCGVIVHETQIGGHVGKTPWFVTSNGLACAQARKVAKDVANEAYAKGTGKKFRVSGWACVDKSGWVVEGEYGQSRIVCKKSSQAVTLSWGA